MLLSLVAAPVYIPTNNVGGRCVPFSQSPLGLGPPHLRIVNSLLQSFTGPAQPHCQFSEMPHTLCNALLTPS